MKKEQMICVKNLLKGFFLLILFSACTAKSKSVEISVENNTDLERTTEMVELSANDVRSKLQVSDTSFLLVKDAQNNIIPSQITFDNKLIFQTDITPQSSKTYYVSVGERQSYDAKVSGRHVSERYGDFAWENDCLGFRFYGKKLKEIQAPTSGLDLWYKRTDKLVLDKWYDDNQSGKASYHEDHGEGCDPYAVGQTLGGGSMAIIQDGVLMLNENFDSYEILDNGPLRVTFRLNYPSLSISGREVTESRLISLDAGSLLTKITQEYNVSEDLVVGAGFPTRASGDSIIYTSGKNYFVYQEPMDEANGQIFLGVLIPEGIDSVITTQSTQIGKLAEASTNLPNVVATTTYKSGGVLTYYTGFGWTKFGYPDSNTFDKYMGNYSSRITKPLTITIK